MTGYLQEKKTRAEQHLAPVCTRMLDQPLTGLPAARQPRHVPQPKTRGIKRCSAFRRRLLYGTGPGTSSPALHEQPQHYATRDNAHPLPAWKVPGDRVTLSCFEGSLALPPPSPVQSVAPQAVAKGTSSQLKTLKAASGVRVRTRNVMKISFFPTGIRTVCPSSTPATRDKYQGDVTRVTMRRSPEHLQPRRASLGPSGRHQSLTGAQRTQSVTDRNTPLTGWHGNHHGLLLLGLPRSSADHARCRYDGAATAASPARGSHDERAGVYCLLVRRTRMFSTETVLFTPTKHLCPSNSSWQDSDTLQRGVSRHQLGTQQGHCQGKRDRVQMPSDPDCH